MNKENESRLAWENAVKVAKAGHRGLQIWPRDRDRITLEDLPVLPEGWSASLKGRAWDVIPVDSDAMLQRVVKVGKNYALGIEVRDQDGFYMVVEF